MPAERLLRLQKILFLRKRPALACQVRLRGLLMLFAPAGRVWQHREYRVALLEGEAPPNLQPPQADPLRNWWAVRRRVGEGTFAYPGIAREGKCCLSSLSFGCWPRVQVHALTPLFPVLPQDRLISRSRWLAYLEITVAEGHLELASCAILIQRHL